VRDSTTLDRWRGGSAEDGVVFGRAGTVRRQTLNVRVGPPHTICQSSGASAIVGERCSGGPYDILDEAALGSVTWRPAPAPTTANWLRGRHAHFLLKKMPSAGRGDASPGKSYSFVGADGRPVLDLAGIIRARAIDLSGCDDRRGSIYGGREGIRARERDRQAKPGALSTGRAAAAGQSAILPPLLEL